MSYIYHYTNGAGLLGMLNNYSKENPYLLQCGQHIYRVKESVLILLSSKGIEWDDNRILKSEVPYRL